MTESPIETIAAATPYLEQVDLEKAPLPELVEAIAKDINRLERLTSPEAEREFFDQKLKKARAHFSFEGVLTPQAASVAREAAEAARTKYRDDIKSTAEIVVKVAPV